MEYNALEYLGAFDLPISPDINVLKTVPMEGGVGVGGTSAGARTFTCPSCLQPFDQGKKRRLIDTCGHERCYTCMFSSEECPLCTDVNSNNTALGGVHIRQNSDTALFHSQPQIPQSISQPTISTQQQQPRPKLRTNGHLILQKRLEKSPSGGSTSDESSEIPHLVSSQSMTTFKPVLGTLGRQSSE